FEDNVLAKLSEGRNGVLAGPSPNDPLLTGKLGEFRGLPLDAEKLKRTRNWRLAQPRADGPLEVYIEGQHARVILARHGVHDTLDGHTAFSAHSYMPADAGQIAANVVLYAMMDKPRPPRPAPTVVPPTPPDAASPDSPALDATPPAAPPPGAPSVG
ncbi:MAG TPA: hypothetical protein VMZ31_00120, partial [Phycisphaerae bacterium]|nr:hypothetical protein [Phycisphaerae bacterium]